MLGGRRASKLITHQHKNEDCYESHANCTVKLHANIGQGKREVRDDMNLTCLHNITVLGGFLRFKSEIDIREDPRIKSLFQMLTRRRKIFRDQC